MQAGASQNLGSGRRIANKTTRNTRLSLHRRLASILRIDRKRRHSPFGLGLLLRALRRCHRRRPTSRHQKAMASQGTPARAAKRRQLCKRTRQLSTEAKPFRGRATSTRARDRKLQQRKGRHLQPNALPPCRCMPARSWQAIAALGSVVCVRSLAFANAFTLVS